MKPAAKEIQLKYIQNDISRVKSEINNNSQILRKYPISVMQISEILQVLNSHKIKYIDPEFPPIDVKYLKL